MSTLAYADEIDDLMQKTLEEQEKAKILQEKQCQNAYGMSCAEYEKDNSMTEKEKILQEKQCQNAYGMSCAEYAEDNSMTEKEKKIFAESLLEGLDSVAPTDEANPLRKFKAPTLPKPKTLPGPGTNIQNTDPSAQNTLLTKIVPRYTIGFIGFIAGVALLFTIIGGARLAMAYGNEEAIEKGKKQITYSLIALVIALLSYTIVNILINISFQ